MYCLKNYKYHLNSEKIQKLQLENISNGHHCTRSACQFASLHNFIVFSDTYYDYSFFFPQACTDHGSLLQSSDNAPAQAAPTQRVVEVAIPDVGTFVIESEEGGYDDEVPRVHCSSLGLPVLPDESFWHDCTL